MKANGCKTIEMGEENMLIDLQDFTTKVNGPRIKEMGMAICRFKSEAFTKGLSRITISSAMALKHLQMETHTKGSTKGESFMERAFTSGLPVQATKENLWTVKSMVRVNGDLTLVSSTWENIFRTKSMDLAVTNGKMDAFTKANSQTIKSIYQLI